MYKYLDPGMHSIFKISARLVHNDHTHLADQYIQH